MPHIQQLRGYVTHHIIQIVTGFQFLKLVESPTFLLIFVATIVKIIITVVWHNALVSK